MPDSAGPAWFHGKRLERRIKIRVSERIAELRNDLLIADAFPWFVAISLSRADNSPPVGHFGANLGPATRVTVTDVIDVAWMSALQGEEAQLGQVFDMNQIDELGRWADTPLPDPLHRVAIRAINAGDTQDDAPMVRAEIFLSLDAGYVGIDGACFIDPWGKIHCGRIASVIGRCAAQDDQFR